MKRLYVLGACLAIAACAPQPSAPVAPAPPPAPPVAAAPPMPANIASADGEYAGPMQLMPTGGETTNMYRSGCTEHRKGRMTVRNDAGQEIDYGPGDVMVVPPGHDAWVIGDEACVSIDWSGMANYAKRH